uniref:Uncharacterized protein n=1 Tax=Oryza brachyantha TaxID=4533 RepID=J3N8N4_ORYBR
MSGWMGGRLGVATRRFRGRRFSASSSSPLRSRLASPPGCLALPAGGAAGCKPHADVRCAASEVWPAAIGTADPGRLFVPPRWTWPLRLVASVPAVHLRPPLFDTCRQGRRPAAVVVLAIAAAAFGGGSLSSPSIPVRRCRTPAVKVDDFRCIPMTFGSVEEINQMPLLAVTEVRHSVLSLLTSFVQALRVGIWSGCEGTSLGEYSGGEQRRFAEDSEECKHHFVVNMVICWLSSQYDQMN